MGVTKGDTRSFDYSSYGYKSPFRKGAYTTRIGF